MYVITGASGNIGKALAKGLLLNGKKVRAIGRNADNLKELGNIGAEISVGDLSNPIFVKKAFEGANAVFCMIPPNPKSTDFRADQQKVADNLFEAVKANNIKHVLLLSSVGAHLRNGAGVVDGLGYMEEKFSALKDTNIVNLRPSYFMENLFGQIGTIKHMGITGSAIRGDLNVPMVATKDIASVAISILNDLQFKGHSIRYVLGSRDVSYSEATSIIGKAIGKPDLKYVQFSYDDAKAGMVQSGFVSANLADLYNGLAKSFNEGHAMTAHTRTAENTSPTTIEEFAQTFAHVYNNQ